MRQPQNPVPPLSAAPIIPSVLPAASTAALPVTRAPSLVLRLLRVLHREPVLFVTLAYLFISVVGIWTSYTFYARFNLPILEYMQSSDFFVSGLRRPKHLFWLVYVVVVMLLVTWPSRLRERKPEWVENLRSRHWWAPMFFPSEKSWQSLWGARSETLWVLGFVLTFALLLNLTNTSRADAVYAGRQGERVRVMLANDQVLAGDSRLLGTSSAYVFLWWPQEKRTRVVPIESIALIESLTAPRKTTTATPAVVPGK